MTLENFILLLLCYFTSNTQNTSASPGPHLVADPSWEERHELWGLVALNLPVLDGFTAQEVVQLSAQHGTGHLLVPRRLLTCNTETVCQRENIKIQANKTVCTDPSKEKTDKTENPNLTVAVE